MTSNADLLRAGYAQAPITPPVGFEIAGPEHPRRTSVDVRDDLLARVIVLAAGGRLAAVVSLDVWGFSEEFAQNVRQLAGHALGTHDSSIWIGCSGNACSPPLWEGAHEVSEGYRAYFAYVPEVVAGAVRRAARGMKPAELGFAEATLPDLATSAHGPWEDIDETVSVLVINGEGGPIAQAVTFGCPASVAGANPPEWTGDYAGYGCWALEQATGGGVIFLRSPSHDVRPFDWHVGNPSPSHQERGARDTQAIGWLLASQAGIAAQRATLRRNVSLDSPMTGVDGANALRVGDGVLLGVREPLESLSGTSLRRQSSGLSLLINSNQRGAAFAEPAGEAPTETVSRALVSRTGQAD